MKNEKNVNIEKIIRIWSDHEKKFDNDIFAEYCDKHSIAHEFSTPKTTTEWCCWKKKQDTSRDGKSYAKFIEAIHKTLGKSN